MATGQLSITPRAFQATSGDDWRLGFTLWEAGSAKNVSAATAIQAALRTTSGETAIAATAQSAGTTGASWATGIVVAAFTASQTASLPAGDYQLEVEVTIGGVRTTWPLAAVSVQIGVIP